MAERMTRYQLAFAPFLNKYINDELSKHYGGRRVTGVLPGLQNQCGALIPSRMGSIPICSRQKRTQLSILTLLIETGLPAASFVLTLFLHFP